MNVRQERRKRIREGYATKEQLTALLEVSSVKERLLWKLLYFYGLRASEGGAIRMDAIDFRRSTIEIERLKGSTSRSYPLLAALKEDLTAWLKYRPKSSPYLFPRARDVNQPLDKTSIWRMFTKTATKAKLPLNLRHPHVLKHSIATHMLEGGDDIRHVQDWLGHSRIDNTIIYAEVTGRLEQKGLAVVSQLAEGLEK